ncbi:unnamed protein product, partial [Staurois parvus]
KGYRWECLSIVYWCGCPLFTATWLSNCSLPCAVSHCSVSWLVGGVSVALPTDGAG